MKNADSAKSSFLSMLWLMLMVFTTSCISGSESVSSVSEERKGSISPKMQKKGGNCTEDEELQIMMMMMTFETCIISRFLVRFCLQF